MVALELRAVWSLGFTLHLSVFSSRQPGRCKVSYCRFYSNISSAEFYGIFWKYIEGSHEQKSSWAFKCALYLLDGSSLSLHPYGAGKSSRLQNSQCTPTLESAHLNRSFHLGLQCFHTDHALSSIQMQDLRGGVFPLATLWAYSSIQKGLIMFFVLHTDHL